jgi:hypothetical protein
MKRFVVVAASAITMLLVLMSSAYSQTPVSAINGSAYTFVVNRVTLSSAFEQEFNDGSAVDSTSIDMVKSGSDWYLWGLAVKSGKTYTCWIKLDVVGGYSYIYQGAGGMVHRCHHPMCNYFPCTLPPVCAGQCSGDGVNCVLINDVQVAAGYLGSFH